MVPVSRTMVSLLCGAAALFPCVSEADSLPCALQRTSIPLESRVGSSSILSNLFYSKDSVKAQLKSMLAAAEVAMKKATAPDLLCPPPCRVNPRPRMKFSAAPQRFRDRYEDQARCEQYFAQTSKVPIAFRNHAFRDFGELSKSFSSLARGSGHMGELLYELCDGSCSPQYTIVVAVDAEAPYQSDIEVVCGPARDTRSSEYDLSTALEWQCDEFE